MVWLISFLRVKINDTDSSIWTDDELQNYLDMHRIHIVREPLLVSPSNEEGTYGQIYYSAFGMLEADASLWDSNLSCASEILSSDYTSNLVDGTFKFANSKIDRYYLDAKSYNIHGIIAECLEQLAMDQNRAKSWSRGSVTYTHYDLMEMARYHRNLAGSKSTSVVRTYVKG
jgi:hypothetical protein